MKAFHVILITLIFTIAQTSMAQNYSLSFDGVDDYVDVLDSDVFSPASLTVEFWNYYVPLPSTPNSRYKYIYKDHPAGGSGVEWGVGINNSLPSGGLFLYVGNQLLELTGAYPISDSWNHIACTFDNATDTLKIYLNGDLIASRFDQLADINNSTGNLYIGKDATNGADPGPVNGKMDEIRIWNRALSHQEIQSKMNQSLNPSQETGLIAYWRFEVGSGNIAYDATVNGNDGTVNGATWSSDVAFSISAPTLISPADNATNIPTNPTFTWSKVDSATNYQLQVATGSNFDATAVDQSGLTDTTYSAQGLSNLSLYYWRVRAINDAGTTLWSGVYSFVTELSAPTLISPANNATNIPTNPTFTWSKVDSATNYQLQVATGSNFDATVIDQSGLTGSTYSANGLSNLSLYYWRVRAINESDTSLWSGVYSFMTEESGNYSLSFDGEGDYVEIPDADILSPSNFTIELWVKQPQLTGGRNTYVHKDRGGAHVEYNLMENPNPSGLYSYAGYGLSESSTHPSENEWSHIAATFDSNADSIEIFLNGISVGTETATDSIINTAGKLYVGWMPTDPGYNALTGIIDEVRISNIVRYTSNFTPPISEFESDSNTVALYHFNEGTGNLVTDASGNGNHGTIFGATWSTETPQLITSVTPINERGLPTQFMLFNNYPNPFNPTTNISYQLPNPGKVELSIYNMLGELVEKLVNEYQEAGFHKVVWDASGIGSGVYFYRLSIGNSSSVRKAIILK